LLLSFKTSDDPTMSDHRIMIGRSFCRNFAHHWSAARACNPLVRSRAVKDSVYDRHQDGIMSFILTVIYMYQGLAYLGEYPLAWAACLCNETIYNILIDEGASPDDQVTVYSST
jgi:hypothetical protein